MTAKPCRRTLLLLLLTGGLTGCAAAGTVAPEAAGLGIGAGVGVLTANPVVGVAVGLAARLVTAEVVGYVETEQQRQVHGAIAAAAGDAAGDTPVTWATTPNPVYSTLFGTVRGQAQVVRDFGDRIRCREIVYTVNQDGGGIAGNIEDPGADLDVLSGGQPATSPSGSDDGQSWPAPWVDRYFVTIICRGTLGWQWAASAAASNAP